jgi:hypothetical protein
LKGKSMVGGWIGVDLDGTLAQYGGWKGANNIGAPIPAMVERVKKWLADGKTVKIFTARVWCPPEPDAWVFESNGKCEYLDRKNEADMARDAIQAWLREHIGQELEITCVKDYGMVELWDDRAVQVVINTGCPIADYVKAVQNA